MNTTTIEPETPGPDKTPEIKPVAPEQPSTTPGPEITQPAEPQQPNQPAEIPVRKENS